MVTYDLYLAAMHFAAFYLSIIVLSLLFGVFGKTTERNKRRYLFCVSAIMFILMGFRGVNMGNDTDSYVEMFYRIAANDNIFDYLVNSKNEQGYILYSWILSRIVPNARILFVVSALFIVVSIRRFAEKYVDNLGVFFSLFIGTLYFDFFLSGLRNAMSIAIFLYAIDALIERKPWRYFIICAIAIVFHNTAIIYFVIYPLCSSRLLKQEHKLIFNILLIVGAFVSGVFLQSMVRVFLQIFPKYTSYLGGAYFDGKGRIAVVLKLAVCLLLVIMPKVVYKNPAPNWQLDGFGKQMAMLNLLVMFVAVNATMFMRVATVLNMYTLMQFSNEVSRMRKINTNKLFLVSCTLAAFLVYGIVIVVFRTPEWQTTYPINLSWAL